MEIARGNGGWAHGRCHYTLHIQFVMLDSVVARNGLILQGMTTHYTITLRIVVRRAPAVLAWVTVILDGYAGHTQGTHE